MGQKVNFGLFGDSDLTHSLLESTSSQHRLRYTDLIPVFIQEQRVGNGVPSA